MVSYLCYVISPIIIAGVVCGLSGKTVSRHSSNRRIFLWICGIVMALMIGLRHYSNGSGDSSFYYSLWKTLGNVRLRNLPSAVQSIDLEKGYLCITWILAKIFPHPQFVFVFSGVFFTVSTCKFIDKNCSDVVLPLLMFNCLGLFNFMVQGLRQGIAICICLWSIEFCKQRKLLKFLLVICLAMVFHSSAVFFVIVYWIYSLKLDSKSLLVFSSLCILGLASRQMIFRVLNFLMNESYEISYADGASGGVVAIFIYFAIIFYGFLIAKLSREQNIYAPFLYMAVLGMMAMILRRNFIGLAERVSFYFAWGQMVVVSEAMAKIKSGKSKMYIYVVIGALCIAVAMYKASYSVLIPYRFFWQ